MDKQTPIHFFSRSPGFAGSGGNDLGFAGSRGFSLIEALVSLGILAMGMLAVMSMQTATLRANLNNQNLLLAQEAAEVAIEWMRTTRMSKSASDAVVKAGIFPAVGKNAISDLDTDFQFTGLSAAVSSFPSGISPDFSRFFEYRAKLAQDPNRDALDRKFVVRIGVEREYRAPAGAQSYLSRCVATVYWLQDGELLSFDTVFFVERQA